MCLPCSGALHESDTIKDSGTYKLLFFGLYRYATCGFICVHVHFCVLQTLPLYAVTHERLGVLGTREYALRLLKTPDVTKGYYAVVEAARRGDLFKHGTV